MILLTLLSPTPVFYVCILCEELQVANFTPLQIIYYNTYLLYYQAAIL